MTNNILMVYPHSTMTIQNADLVQLFNKDMITTEMSVKHVIKALKRWGYKVEREDGESSVRITRKGSITLRQAITELAERRFNIKIKGDKKFHQFCLVYYFSSINPYIREYDIRKLTEFVYSEDLTTKNRIDYFQLFPWLSFPDDYIEDKNCVYSTTYNRDEGEPQIYRNIIPAESSKWSKRTNRNIYLWIDSDFRYSCIQAAKKIEDSELSFSDLMSDFCCVFYDTWSLSPTIYYDCCNPATLASFVDEDLKKLFYLIEVYLYKIDVDYDLLIQLMKTADTGTLIPVLTI